MLLYPVDSICNNGTDYTALTKLLRTFYSRKIDVWMCLICNKRKFKTEVNARQQGRQVYSYSIFVMDTVTEILVPRKNWSGRYTF